MEQLTHALAAGHVLRSAQQQYRIERVLGSGGFGITYEATTSLKMGNLTVKVKVAVKEHFLAADCEREADSSRVVYSNPARVRVENSRKDFIAEARRLHKVGVEHPNIVKVNEVFEANNTAYYVMEYLDGESLRAYVREHGPLSEDEMHAIMTPIIDAVKSLHAARMTHLDIKPDNIMLTRDDDGNLRPVLIDFGLSKHYDAEGRPTSTINTLGCSDGYAPTEQYSGITTFSPSADIYALGATMAFCLTGRDPQKSTELGGDTLAGTLPAAVSEKTRATIDAMTCAKAARRTLPGTLPQQSSADAPWRVPTSDSPKPMVGTRHGASTPANTTQTLGDKKPRRRWPWVAAAVAAAALVAVLAFGSKSAPSAPSAPSEIAATDTETFTANGVSFDMVRVPGGTFQMGSNDGDSDEKPIHSVTVSGFSIGKTEVTQALWKAVMGSNPSYFVGDNLPVERVSWNDCQDFIRKLNSLTGRNFRLPTEAEWEYASRGGNRSNGYKYSGSDNLGSVAWYDDNSGGTTHAVGTKAANELGIHDMSGNVWEWTSDWYGSDYYSQSSGATNPKGPSSGSDRVFRGGSWYYYAVNCRSAIRYNGSPSYRYHNLGFRLAL